ncbi:ribonuclease R [Haloplasma contractile]|uniref:Ribonuclease R n=1 Tax=Haloplasma contractile SSD-17B TaxID=1033810 RepID=U2DYJ0_9MOLU|nr:ribonuclease R [Haloplasma contractile]ERJ13322.1 Ribonuclease R protein [Haloplasma contractile SSD-17B]
MKEKLLNLFKDEAFERSTVEEISEKLNIEGADEFKKLVKTVVALEDEGILYRDKNDAFDLIERFGFYKGHILVHQKGFAFVEVLDHDMDDIFIPKDNINGALHKDIVLVRIAGKRKGASKEGEVVKVYERGIKEVIGVYDEVKGVGYVIPDNKKYQVEVIVNKNNSKGAIPEHKVKVEIINFISESKVEGKVTEILGHKNDPGIDILSAVYKYGIPTDFEPETLKQAEEIPDVITDKDLEGRRDLRDQTIVTIDGADAKDLDDAVTVTKLDNGNYKLGVHIADVSYYVREGDPIDREAFNRGTSVYLVDRVIPMIPHRLSNGICSLNPQVNRLVLSCEMEIDQTGDVVEHEIFQSVIKTTERMTYNAVNEILLDKNEQTRERYKDLIPLFERMHELFKILKKRRTNRGAINFETNEARIIVDEDGKPYDIKVRKRRDAEKIIEEFMLVANETVAEHFHWLNFPFIYRIHEDPKPEKLKRFYKVLNGLGYKIKGKENTVHPKAFQGILETVKGEPEEAVVNTLLVRSMAKAKYSEQSVGHYGLATEFYTHFTSPIRRYPDTIVHRLIREYIINGKIDEQNLTRWGAIMPEIGLQTSKRERDAIDCEREVDDMKKAEYMEDKVGMEFDGIISSVTSWGIYVELENTIEGLVHVLDLTDDYYEYDEDTVSLIGKRTKKIFRLGDTVRVKVISASKEEREVDFEIVGVKSRKHRPKKVVEVKGGNGNGGKKPKRKPMSRKDDKNGKNQKARKPKNKTLEQ